MDLLKNVVDPDAIDLVREAFEDDVAWRRILRPGFAWDTAKEYVDSTKEHLIWSEGPAGLHICQLIDVERLVPLGIDVNCIDRASLAFQAAHLACNQILVAADRNDLLLGVVAHTLDPKAVITYSPASVCRRLGTKIAKALKDVESLRVLGPVMANGRMQLTADVDLPRTLDRHGFATSSLIKMYARSRGLDINSVDPVNTHYVSGLENWHRGNRPEDFRSLDSGVRRHLLHWIHATFEEAASTRPCPASSYGLKHLFERIPVESDVWNGIEPHYVTNGQFKGAMIALGYLPDRPNAVNPEYRIKFRPGVRQELRNARLSS